MVLLSHPTSKAVLINPRHHPEKTHDQTCSGHLWHPRHLRHSRHLWHSRHLRHSGHTGLRHAGKWKWPIFWNIVRRHLGGVIAQVIALQSKTRRVGVKSEAEYVMFQYVTSSSVGEILFGKVHEASLNLYMASIKRSISHSWLKFSSISCPFH